jgi:hypothetical protein
MTGDRQETAHRVLADGPAEALLYPIMDLARSEWLGRSPKDREDGSLNRALRQPERGRPKISRQIQVNRALLGDQVVQSGGNILVRECPG